MVFEPDLSRILAAVRYKKRTFWSLLREQNIYFLNTLPHASDKFSMSALFTIMVMRVTLLWLRTIGLDILQEWRLKNVATRNKFPCRYIDY